MTIVHPLVSAIIPVYNGERYVTEAIESVLQQGRSDCEVIIVDDGSTDNSGTVVKTFPAPVRYFAQPHTGDGAARNRGVVEARGQFLAFLDADDLWTERKLEIQLDAFDADASLDLAFGHVEQGVSPELSEAVKASKAVPEKIIPGHIPGTMLAKREAFLRVGPYATSWKIGTPMEWYLRAVELQLRMIMLPDVLLWRRVHESNTGIHLRDSRHEYMHILKAALDRRRASERQSMARAPTRSPRGSSGT